jgi:glycosyltransferase involved in cell wall biosynthesis
MLEKITKYQKNFKGKFRFAVLIPTWNNLEFLRLCINSLRKNSFYELQIIVFVNDGKDDTIAWLEEQKNIDYIHSEDNVGICYGLNLCRSLIRSDYVVYLNDDMYVLPNWDLVLDEEIKKINSKEFMLSATMIEPHDTGNPCVVVKDYGQNIDDFNEDLLLKEYAELSIADWNGSTWPPNVVHIDLWDLVGGLSIEFSPGMYSDPDFSRKLYESGVRIFKGKGSSLVYHFVSKSTGRVKKNKGRKTFLLKWGITSNTFTNKYLMRGNEFHDSLEKPQISYVNSFINKLKKVISSWD